MMSVGGYLGLFNGTPMKNVIRRLLGVRIDKRAFLMKGQEVPAFTRWRGNPAAETGAPLVLDAAAGSVSPP